MKWDLVMAHAKRWDVILDQQRINNAEWEDDRNWSGPRWLGIYFSKNDTRTMVPKRIPTMGWTINVGRPGGVFALVGIIVGIPLLIILVNAYGG